jgi:hypothetical protein
VTSAVTNLKFLAANPLDHAAKIKELFRADGETGFAEFFDRAYPAAVPSGAKSWVGIDGEGRLVMHIARFPRRFALGGHTVVGGVLLDLMAAKSHRTFVPAVTLMRQMMTDTKRERDVDFLYAIPNAQAAALLKAAGFSIVGTVGRFVFPLADERWYADLATRAYRMIVRIRSRNGRVEAVEHAAHAFDARVFEQPVGAAPGLRPFRPPELYRQVLSGYPTSADRWFTFHRGGRSTRPFAAVSVRAGADRVATLLSLAREPSTPLSAIVPGLGDLLRRAGQQRLSLSTLTGTRFADELTRAGFLQRPDSEGMLGYAVTESGADALRSIASWEITGLDGDPH